MSAAGPVTAWERHLAIQAFKQSGAAVQDGVDYAYVVAPQLYDGSLMGLAKRLVFSLFFSLRTVRTTRRQRDILVFYANRAKQRADYDFIAGELQRVVGDDGEYAEAAERFDPLQWVATLARLPGAVCAVSAYRARLIDQFGAALLIAKYRSSRPQLARLLPGKRTLVTFCDALPVENLLAQMARAVGIFTLTAQHGQYRLLDESNISPDAEAYANFVSDRMLCWGEATRAEFERAGFDPERFIVTGWIRPWKATRARPAATPAVFGVMLNGENGKDSNVDLISAAKAVAQSTGMTYFVRVHPQTQLNAIRPLVDDRCAAVAHIDLEPYLASVAFSLGHMSGAIVEVLHEGHPTYLFDDGRLADVFRVDGLSYGSVDDLITAVKADAASGDTVRRRMVLLSNWYNESTDQAHRIREAILNLESRNA